MLLDITIYLGVYRLVEKGTKSRTVSSGVVVASTAELNFYGVQDLEVGESTARFAGNTVVYLFHAKKEDTAWAWLQQVCEEHESGSEFTFKHVPERRNLEVADLTNFSRQVCANLVPQEQLAAK